jgi:L-ascorbate metabolism protein UlaG (beta-lactamase superfamily)
MEIQLLGHSMLRIVSEEGKVIVVDPWISGNPTCPVEWQKSEKWSDVDLVLCTHAHFDHSTGMDEVLGANDRVMGVVQYEYFLRQFAGTRNNVFPLNFGGSYPLLNNIRVTLVPANHSASFGEEASFKNAGLPAGFVIRLEHGFTIYVSGDTGFMSEMKTLIGDFYKPDLAVLSVSDIFTMDPAEGAYAASLIGAKYNIPCHWFPKVEDAANPDGMRALIEAFPPVNFMLEKHLDFAKEMEKHKGLETILLEPGKSFSPGN